MLHIPQRMGSLTNRYSCTIQFNWDPDGVSRHQGLASGIHFYAGIVVCSCVVGFEIAIGNTVTALAWILLLAVAQG